MRYSENNAWKKKSNNDGNTEEEYELEIEFNENINLENKKKNNISISSSLLQSLTNLIENIMGIETNDPSSTYFSMWYVNVRGIFYFVFNLLIVITLIFF